LDLIVKRIALARSIKFIKRCERRTNTSVVLVNRSRVTLTNSICIRFGQPLASNLAGDRGECNLIIAGNTFANVNAIGLINHGVDYC
jgi:hypothetical protein